MKVLSITDGVATIQCDDGSFHQIEAAFIGAPALTKAREITKPYLNRDNLLYRLVDLSEDAMDFPLARKYIAWGIAQGFDMRPGCRVRNPWFIASQKLPADIFIPIGHKRRPVVGICRSVVASDNLVGITLNDFNDAKIVGGSVLGAYTMLLYEVTGRANFGQGLLKTQTYEIADLLILNPAAVKSGPRKAFEVAFDYIAQRPPQMIYDEVMRDDRKVLDDAFLLAVGFSDPAERADVLAELHDATCRRVWERQAKAEKTREARQTYDDWLASGLPFGNVDEE